MHRLQPSAILPQTYSRLSLAFVKHTHKHQDFSLYFAHLFIHYPQEKDTESWENFHEEYASEYETRFFLVRNLTLL